MSLDPGFTAHGEIDVAQLTPPELFAHAVACYAGPAAVSLLCPGIDPGGGGDERDALMLSTYARDNTQRWLRRARAMAAELVADQAEAIKMLASKLMERRKLSGSELFGLYFAGPWDAQCAESSRKFRAGARKLIARRRAA